MNQPNRYFDLLREIMFTFKDVCLEYRNGWRALTRNEIPFIIDANDDIYLLVSMGVMPSDLSNTVNIPFADSDGGIAVAWLPSENAPWQDLVRMAKQAYQDCTAIDSHLIRSLELHITANLELNSNATIPDETVDYNSPINLSRTVH